MPNPLCECPAAGWCKRHKIEKTDRQHQLCSGVADATCGGRKYWIAWEKGLIDGATPPANPVTNPPPFKDTSHIQQAPKRTVNVDKILQDRKAALDPKIESMTPGLIWESKKSLPGTELSVLLAKIGITPSGGCKCKEYATKMDNGGPEWCEKNIVQIVDWMQGEANKRRIPFLRVAARQMVKLAVSRSRKNGPVPSVKNPVVDRVEFGPDIKRNLIYHVYPVKGDMWKWNLDQLLSRIELFNGRKIVGITYDDRTENPEVVKEYLKGHVDEFIIGKNNKLGEGVTAVPLLRQLESSDSNEITFRGHTKGVSREQTNNRLEAVKSWTEIMYSVCLDDSVLVSEKLTDHGITGPFRRHKKLGRAPWYYSGSFYWFRNRDVYQRDWESIERERWGVESWPGMLFKKDEASCIFDDKAGSLYGDHYHKVSRDAFTKWTELRKQVDNKDPIDFIDSEDDFDVTLITPTGDRPDAFRLCEKWMSRQTFKGSIQWIVVDDGTSRKTETAQGQEYYRREPSRQDPPHTLALNLKESLNHIRSNKILFIEDDEWYSPDYVKEMSDLLDEHELVGDFPANYYYLRGRTYRTLNEHKHCSLCRTAIRREMIGELMAAFKGDEPSIDMRLWGSFTGDSHKRTGNPLTVGIKGMPGRPCGGGSPDKWKADADLAFLKKMIGDDVESYLPYLAKGYSPDDSKSESIVVYTSIVNQYDALVNPLVVNSDCQYVCFTDSVFTDESLLWEQRVITREYDCPSRESRKYKMGSHSLFSDADWTIYIDGQLRLLVDPVELIAECKAAAEADLYLFSHHERNDIYEESREVQRIGFDRSVALKRQIEKYRSDGMEDGSGLYLGGILIRRNTTGKFNDLWWSEYLSGSHRDQISLPYAIEKSGVKHHAFAPMYWENFFKRQKHTGKRLVHSVAGRR